MTVSYLRDTAQQAGLKTRHLFVRDIGWNAAAGSFRDLDDLPISTLFALYPWEWLLQDFADPILSTCAQMNWIEPIWKMLWSNKALLAVLWEMFPGHPNLLPAYLDGSHLMRNFVRKPLLSREGANITIHKDGAETASTSGPYGSGGFVYQALAPECSFDGHTPVIGSWYITDCGPAGIGIREAEGITTNVSRFVPHYFD
jgi:glutathionylspermidine synthase